MTYEIDPSRRMYVSGSVTRDISQMTSHPIHGAMMDLAEQTLNPRFLILASPLEEASFEMPAREFLEWVNGQPDLAAIFYENLQCMCEIKGEPLLTTWFSADRFWAMLSEGKGAAPVVAIALHAKDWGPLGLDEVYFEFHVVGSVAVAEQNESIAELVDA